MLSRNMAAEMVLHFIFTYQHNYQNTWTLLVGFSGSHFPAENNGLRLESAGLLDVTVTKQRFIPEATTTNLPTPAVTSEPQRKLITFSAPRHSTWTERLVATVQIKTLPDLLSRQYHQIQDLLQNPKCIYLTLIE